VAAIFAKATGRRLLTSSTTFPSPGQSGEFAVVGIYQVLVQKAFLYGDYVG
jgi:hypothetical protein